MHIGRIGGRVNIIIDGHSLATLGGMERVTCDLASAQAQRGHNVFMFISDPLPKNPLYVLDKRVQCVHYKHGGRQKHIAAFRQQILDCMPDVCVSPAVDRRHLPWCAALWGTGIPLVISEHLVPEIIEQNLWNRAERLAVMSAADAIHLLLGTYAHSLPQYLHDRIHILPNAVMLPILSLPSPGSPVIISMGRLSKEKQNSLLIDAFAQIVDNFPEWHVHIWGAGPEHKRLHSKIKMHKLEDRIFLCGLTTKPEQCYIQAQIVCLPSRYEGFPGAITEAMTAGLPTVGFAQCPGVNELIQHNLTGLLAPDMTAASLAESLHVLMADATLRQRMGQTAREAAQAFSPSTVYDAWEHLLCEAAAHKGRTHLQKLEKFATLSPELREHANVLKHCIARPNVLVGDGQCVRRLVFQFPWLKRLLHPLYTWFKYLRWN